MEKKDDSKIRNKKREEKPDDQTTIISDRESIDNYEDTLTLREEDEKTHDKTIAVFDIDDITRKLRDEIDDIPEADMDEMDSGQLSGIIKNIFPERTEAEQLKINRHFLRDAEPFRLERLLEDMKNRPEGIATGFAGIDQHVSIPNSSLTIITSEPRHGKSIFMMNLLLNMASLYKDKHFLFYTYEEVKRDIETKLINMSGDTPFKKSENVKTNLARWKYILRTKDPEELKNLSKQEPEYTGLAKFVEIAQRIHIIDQHYDIVDLIDSIRSFYNTFKIGAAFVDFFQKIKPEKKGNLPRQQQLQDISGYLREAADRMKLPFICGAQFSAVEKGLPEYDVLTADNIMEIWNLEWAANLVIGLQDYARSKFIGSNINDSFKSKLFEHKLIKPEKIQGSFSNKDEKSIVLVKVLVNREGLEPEEELLLHKPLLKIRDLTDEDIRLIRKNLV
ncbi:MAG: hypothetical protein KAT34_05030 [Candidatus Aminicenantes bacterium]|nr:hypothetical protein [Candidatus Aminicenantes bacterium]